MKYYNIGNKSKMNIHESNKCCCAVCNSNDRYKSRSTLKREFRKEVKEIIDSETE